MYRGVSTITWSGSSAVKRYCDKEHAYAVLATPNSCSDTKKIFLSISFRIRRKRKVG